jgi:hypothetical protein
MDADRLKTALESTLLGDPATTETDIDRFFSPDYTQVTDGKTSNRAAFGAHIRHLRSISVHGSVTIADFVTDGQRIADRHIVQGHLVNGEEVSFEVLLIGELDADDRIRRVVETTRQLSGDASHAGLGSATA